MRRGDKTVLFIEIIALIILLFNSIIHPFISIIGMAVFVSIMLIILSFTSGSTSKMLNDKTSFKLTLFYSISFLVLKYALGLITGFYKNSFDLSFIGILKNVVPVLIIVFASELSRNKIVNRSNGDRIMLIITMLLFTFIDFGIVDNFDRVNNLKTFLELLTTSFVSALFKNIALTLIIYKNGLKSSLTYNLIYSLYIYFIPILPGLSEYVETITMMFIPLLVMVLLRVGVPEFIHKKKRKNNAELLKKHTFSKVYGVFMFILVVLIVSLNSNIFRFWICVVGSGSMTPTIKIGDIILVDKSYKHRLKELKVGDVLVFTIEGETYTHRIIEVIEENGEIAFSTQGDRKGQAVDSWIVTKDEVVGLNLCHFDYIGLPAIWLKNLVEGSK